MIKREKINGVAHRLSNEVLSVAEKNELYTDLIINLGTDIKNIVKNFLTTKGIVSYGLDSCSYESALMFEGITNAVNGYDMNKGDFTSRLKTMSTMWLSNQFRKDFSKTAVEFNTKAVSFDMLYEGEEFDIEYTDNEVESLGVMTAEQVIAKFVKTDKEGQVIAILASVSGQKEKNSALSAYFGKYEATERKKVQRIKERLKQFLLNNGVTI